MPILQLAHVQCRPAGRNLFEPIDWSLEPGDCVGLVGPNGAGKSTLLQLLAGLREPDEGSVSRRRGLSVAYLAQDVALPPDVRLIDAALAPEPALAAVESELAEAEERLAEPRVQNDPQRLQRALEQQEAVLSKYEALGGPSHGNRVRGLLTHLGFDEASDFDRPAQLLSGGETKLVALARLLAARPDVLLLDEPDNHLDLDAKARLESLLTSFEGCTVIVSHDRYLLDELVDDIAELDARLAHYHGNYSAYTSQRELAKLHQRKAFADQQKEIARIEAAIRRFELWASMVVNERHIKQARSRRRALDRMEERGEIIERPREAQRMRLSLPGERGSEKAVEVRRLSLGFDDDLLLLGVDWLVRHGERVGVVGPNGCGKSVLMRALAGELEPLDGEVVRGPSTRAGYYAQRHETLTPWLDRTPLELVRHLSPMSEGAAVALLARFLFRFDQVSQPVRVFSGGERSRLQLACVMLGRPNLLLLDEPTNNLDIPSAEVLEAELEHFEGSIIVVSHDRYFLDRVVDRVVAVEDGTLVEYEGGYTDYRAAG